MQGALREQSEDLGSNLGNLSMLIFDQSETL
jgi:hypothetical protein